MFRKLTALAIATLALVALAAPALAEGGVTEEIVYGSDGVRVGTVTITQEAGSLSLLIEADEGNTLEQLQVCIKDTAFTSKLNKNGCEADGGTFIDRDLSGTSTTQVITIPEALVGKDFYAQIHVNVLVGGVSETAYACPNNLTTPAFGNCFIDYDQTVVPAGGIIGFGAIALVAAGAFAYTQRRRSRTAA